MLKWAVVFLVIALITGYMGFKSSEANAQKISRVIFILTALLFGVFLILALIRGNRCAL